MERLPRQKPFRLASPQMLEDLHDIGGVQLMEELLQVYMDDAIGRLRMLSKSVESTSDIPPLGNRLDLRYQDGDQEAADLLEQLEQQFERVKSALAA